MRYVVTLPSRDLLSRVLRHEFPARSLLKKPPFRFPYIGSKLFKRTGAARRGKAIGLCDYFLCKNEPKGSDMAVSRGLKEL